MSSEVTDPAAQAQIKARFVAKHDAVKRRQALLLGARFGPTWIYFGLAVVVWGLVGASWLLDWSLLVSVARPLFWTGPIGMLAAWLLMVRGVARNREVLLLRIIEEDAPESYRWLQKEKII